ncbi:hypothetical protein PsorP6_011114 [Peronosclerospora sorghi]|uniref:Uncharacterized protein n=1 Tax=Peronosclerospora sorghi TaxID=230839 RepID=A0ACC0VVL9_9STRA|nr:hypothetical protein PsorP6_011114 [Peronosclerospora sorghi]
MRMVSVALIAVALGVTAAQTSTTTLPSTNTTTLPSTNPMILASTNSTLLASTNSTTVPAPSPSSKNSGDSLMANVGSVSCSFRYAMPTATNLSKKNQVAASPSSPSNASPSTDSANGADDSKSISDRKVDGGSNDSFTVSNGPISSTPTKNETTIVSSQDTPPSNSSTKSTTASSTLKPPSSTPTPPSSSTTESKPPTETPASTPPAPSADEPSGSQASGRRLVGEVDEGDGETPTSTVPATSSSNTSTPTSAKPTSGSPNTTTTVPSSPPSTPSTSLTPSPYPTPLQPTASSETTSARVANATTAITSSDADPPAVSFPCDRTFYSAWTTMGLTCGETPLDVDAAAASAQCSIYSGTASGLDVTNLATCLSVCRFPACTNGTWDYASDDGLSSPVYANLDLLALLQAAGPLAAAAVRGVVAQPFSNLTFATTTECAYTSDESFRACPSCSALANASSSDATPADAPPSPNAQYTVPVNKGLEDANHWPDGSKKSTVDKAGIASTTIAGSAATVSVVAGGVMSVASGVVGGTSAGMASGASAAASVGITMAAVDLCQFSIMLTQMNVDARPRFLENMGKQMAPAAFTFLPFGASHTPATNASDGVRRLTEAGASPSGSGVQGMEKYAALIGVKPDMLFYLAVAGIACMIGILFALYMLAMGLCCFIVSDFPTFSRKWLDKAIGVLMMILILSQYVVGATGMYQICSCIDHGTIDLSFFLAILALVGIAFGTILYGIIVIKNNEDELRDLGTKDHLDKKFHNRYGPLYDEHSFEGRFFFAPKLLLALLCGMTTGMVWIKGLWQIIVLITFHIAFLMYMEMKQPYPTAFVQKTSSFVIIIKISALFLSFFLLSSATSFTESIPDDLRQGVAFAIVGLQVLVLVCLMIRQMYIFYRTWKLKRDSAAAHDKSVTTVASTNSRDGSGAFFALGGAPQPFPDPSANPTPQSLGMLGDESTPCRQNPFLKETPASGGHALRPPYGGSQGPVQRGLHRKHEVDL